MNKYQQIAVSLNSETVAQKCKRQEVMQYSLSVLSLQ